MSSVSGVVFQIQRWSLHDGDGIRSTVFLKGCPLRCGWCANAESWNLDPDVLYLKERCAGCGKCSEVCPVGASRMQDGKCVFDRRYCTACGKCCGGCPAGARKKMGSIMTVQDVMKAIKRDAIFYRESGGGVTFSGGEPFAQPLFLRELVAACNRMGIDITVETSGYFNWEEVQDILENVDTVFVDIKHMDDGVHKKATGVSNSKILANIKRMAQLSLRMIVRIPLIAGFNDGEDNISEVCRFLKQNACINGIELLPYHFLGEGKREALGMAAVRGFVAPDAAGTAKVKEIIASQGIQLLDFK